LENTWMRKTRNHFINDDFRYILFEKRLAFYLLSTGGLIYLIPLSITLVFLLPYSKAHSNPMMMTSSGSVHPITRSNLIKKTL
jgi:hypothetical protein